MEDNMKTITFLTKREDVNLGWGKILLCGFLTKGHALGQTMLQSAENVYAYANMRHFDYK